MLKGAVDMSDERMDEQKMVDKRGDNDAHKSKSSFNEKDDPIGARASQQVDLGAGGDDGANVPAKEIHAMLRARGQLTIPPEIRRAAHLEENAPVVMKITPEGVLLRPGKIVVADQSWFWSERWQRMEREADADIAAGRVARFDDVDGFIADLES